MNVEGGGGWQPSGLETREKLPADIFVWASDTMVTHKSQITDQGFGYDTPIRKPEITTKYRWEGRIPGLYSFGSKAFSEYLKSGGEVSSLAVLAEDLVAGISRAKERTYGRSDIKISFGAPTGPQQTRIPDPNVGSFRGLNEREKVEFITAFDERFDLESRRRSSGLPDKG